MFKQEVNGVYHLKIPFENIFTSAFLVELAGEKILLDCGTEFSDVDDFVIPALKKTGLELSDIRYLLLTHKHADHCGGLGRVLELNPDIKIIDSVCKISEGVEVYALPGHTRDCIGLLHIPSGTLITGDGLQGSSVGNYKCFLECPNEYKNTLKKLQNDKRINNILLSHAYNPWKTHCFLGRQSVDGLLADCYDISVDYCSKQKAD